MLESVEEETFDCLFSLYKFDFSPEDSCHCFPRSVEVHLSGDLSPVRFVSRSLVSEFYVLCNFSPFKG